MTSRIWTNPQDANYLQLLPNEMKTVRLKSDLCDIEYMAASDTTARHVPAPKLTDFQQNILHILRAGSQHGLGIKEDLRDYYEKEVNHGQLYPNLDDLAELGLVEKSKRDKRTNEYELSDAGEKWLTTRRSWEGRFDDE